MLRRVIVYLWVFCCTVALLGVALVSNAAALGLGLYGGGGGNKANWDVDYSGTGIDSSYQKNTEHKSFGLVMDTAVAKDKLFNYRLNLGYDEFISKPGEGAAKYVMQGLVLDNDFGFGIVRAESVRVWLGPELRIAFFEGEDRFSGGASGRDIDLFGVGIGLVLGVNVNLGEDVALGFKVGYLANSYYGKGTGKLSSDSDADYTVREKLPVASIALIFRLGSD